MAQTGILQLYVAKGARVYYSGLLSILIPSYLAALGYSGFYIGAALVAILAGNVFSNLALTYLQDVVGKKRHLQVFSLMMVAAGLLFASGSSFLVIVLACFLGNISTTGTEAGPFQSIEAGILPQVSEGTTVEAFGKYNLIGYGAAAAGAFSAGAPDLLAGGLLVYRGLFAGFAAVGVLMLALYSTLASVGFRAGPTRRPLAGESRKELTRLSTLFSVDAFGGSFVSQYVLATWFLLTYGLSAHSLGEIFTVTSVIVAFSVYGASKIARVLGNLRTMVLTHLVSNLFLLAIPFAGSLFVALALLFLRQSLSQMDVPTRQALMTEIFVKEDRVTAFAVTNTARSVASFAGGPFNAALLSLGAVSGLLFTGGISKIIYDVTIFAQYRNRFH